jgi:hypothetical protein
MPGLKCWPFDMAARIVAGSLMATSRGRAIMDGNTVKRRCAMQPDPSRLLSIVGPGVLVVGVYDAPDATAFAPLVAPQPGARTCVFGFYRNWLNGETLHISRDNYGCGGAGRALCGVQTRARDEFIRFLVDDEGLKASHDLMEQWLDARPPYRPEHGHLLIGPLRPEQYDYLRTVTFYVTPDQFSLLALGAQYFSAPADPPPVIAPFGSGCGQLLSLFDDLSIPQALAGATDIAMRQHLPADLLALTVTRPMFEQLCALDERSFLYKPFWRRLTEARKAD